MAKAPTWATRRTSRLGPGSGSSTRLLYPGQTRTAEGQPRATPASGQAAAGAKLAQRRPHQTSTRTLGSATS
eukprot:779339-Alexandrium_andersonii.AAC.1